MCVCVCVCVCVLILYLCVFCLFVSVCLCVYIYIYTYTRYGGFELAIHMSTACTACLRHSVVPTQFLESYVVPVYTFISVHELFFT